MRQRRNERSVGVRVVGSARDVFTVVAVIGGLHNCRVVPEVVGWTDPRRIYLLAGYRLTCYTSLLPNWGCW